MTDMPRRGPEKPILQGMLDRQRDVMRWKLDGLDDETLRRPMTPSGTNLLGLLKHLAAVEFGWFCGTFGREHEPLPFDADDENADLRVAPHETTADILAFYDRARSAADAVIADLDLDTIGTAWTGMPVSLRWVVLHLIEETARHAGHADLVREEIDGTVGYLPPRDDDGLAADGQPFGRIEADDGHAMLCFSRTFPAPADAVWRALTDPGQLHRWLGEAEIDVREGGRVTIAPTGEDREVSGTVVTLRPGGAIGYEWRSADEPESQVRFDLRAEGDGTRLDLCHQRLGAATAPGRAAGWHARLARLAAHVEGRPVPQWDPIMELTAPAYADAAPGHERTAGP